ncbi:MAG TPA: GNAT family protein [Beutenbergiaceae bacterium]|nr:GNAT family protein [Beutenbergiaceae bacterium]
MPLTHQDMVLRPMRRRDRDAWSKVRAANFSWLTPWEATAPNAPARPMTFGQYVHHQRRQARSDVAHAFVIEVAGELLGQVTIAGIARGSLQSAHVGYWISEHVAGRGLMPRAVALAIDYAFTELDLHRVEVNIRPENTASLRVVQKLGLREEGRRLRFLHIQGQWRDHRSFALTREEVDGSLLDRLTPNPG